jgi:predicted nucleic acid-binding protein
MSGSAFVDTKVLVYARDKGAGDKQARAESLLLELWESRRGRVSIQVLNEYFVTVTRKLKPGMSADEAWADLSLLQAWAPVPLDWRLVERGRSIHKEHRLSWWDALVVAAAQRCDCEVLYSEDMAHGSTIGGVRIENPFVVG